VGQAFGTTIILNVAVVLVGLFNNVQKDTVIVYVPIKVLSGG
jgi:hypothetical protein